MQVPPPSGSAAGAGGIVSQAGSKNTAPAAEQARAAPAAGGPSDTVEQSERSNADRDAQGQGERLGDEAREEHRDSEEQARQDEYRPAPPLPGEEPGELDIVG